jgi:hypothetical protein
MCRNAIPAGMSTIFITHAVTVTVQNANLWQKQSGLKTEKQSFFR